MKKCAPKFCIILNITPRPVNPHDFIVSLTILDLISRSHDNIVVSHDLKALATHALLHMRVQTPLSSHPCICAFCTSLLLYFIPRPSCVYSYHAGQSNTFELCTSVVAAYFNVLLSREDISSHLKYCCVLAS